MASMERHGLLSDHLQPSTRNKYKHVLVQLRCSLLQPDHSVTINLPSDDWGSNLNFILQTIRNKFEFVSPLKDSEWLLLANGTIIDRNNATQFGEMLSAQIPPIAILEIALSLDALVKKQINIPP
eukprot:215725_1